MRIFLSAALGAFALSFASPAMSLPVDADPSIAGLPYDRAWSIADYPNAAPILQGLPDNGLPRSSTPRGAALIEHMTSPDAVAFCADHGQPLQSRLEQCLAAFEAVNTIFGRYAAAAQHDLPTYADDVMRVGTLAFKLAEHGCELAHEFIPTIPRDDPSYDARLAGWDQMRLGVSQMLTGGLQMLQSPGVFSEPVRETFSRQVANLYRIIAADLSANTRTQILASIAALRQTESNPAVRDAFAGLEGA